MGRLILASNRTADPGTPRAGGLAVALWDVMSERGGIWFGWSGDVTPTTKRGVRVVGEGAVQFALADLTEEEHQGYYLDYSNRTLWPICHYRVDLAEFDETSFEQYEAVNRRFGRLLAPMAAPGDLIWVHDYHLLLLGRELRHNGWSGPIGFFLHIPFPAPEVFTALPQHQRLARGMAEFDLLGFQTERDTANFRRYMVEHHEAELLDEERLKVFGRVIRAKAFPIGTDPDEFASFAMLDEARAAAEKLGRITDNRSLVLGVDRMDYSKGLPERMRAFGKLLDDNAGMHGRVTFVQIAPTSRSAVDAYRDLREELDGLAGRINGDYSDLDWTPIRYIARGYPRETLAGLYRLARVGLVTPLHDGMNLVAKEFIAAQDPEDPGVLVLSEFAGAAEQMREALLVNPHDTAGVADAIGQALSMPLEERKQRWTALMDGLRREDVKWWRNQFLDELAAVEL